MQILKKALLHMIAVLVQRREGKDMATSSFTKNFELKSPEAKQRFEQYEAEKGVTIKVPDRNPLEKGREILAQKFSRSKN